MQVDLNTILQIADYMRTGKRPGRMAYLILCQDEDKAHQHGSETDSTDDPITIEEISNMLNFIKLKGYKPSFGSKKKVEAWIEGEGFKGKWSADELQLKLEGTTWMWWL